MSAPPKPIKVEDEDLEDLDDVLDQFAAPPPPPPSAAPQSLSATPKPAGTGAQGNRPRTNTRVDAPPKSIPGSGLHGTSGSAPLGATSEEGEDEVDLNEEELSRAFSEELTKGMEGLMKELGSEGKDGDLEDDDAEVAKKFREAWEKMLTEGMNGMGGDLGGLEQFLEQGGAEGSSATGSAKAAGAGKDDFQSKIRQTMGKLKESESNLQNQAPGASAGDGLDSFEALLKSLANLGEDGKLPESDEDLASMLEGMMGQLLHKDILYDPLKELNDAFPPYLANPPQPLSEEDRQRYNKQIELIQQILKVFENPKYSDEDKEMSKEISDLMNELQNYGSPPTEIMGELPPGMQLGPDGLPSADNCTIA